MADVEAQIERALSEIKALGLNDVPVHRHAAVMNVEELIAAAGHLPGVHTKNLFLKDKKGNYFLVRLVFVTA
jgi:Ala-tRNA(Pro) deacylase